MYTLVSGIFRATVKAAGDRLYDYAVLEFPHTRDSAAPLRGVATSLEAAQTAAESVIASRHHALGDALTRRHRIHSRRQGY